MSRMGKRPVPFDSKVKATLKGNNISLKGPLGELSYQASDLVKLSIEGNEISVAADFETKEGRTMGGTARALIRNMVEGVSVGFKSTLLLKGVGYRAQAKGQNVTLNLGYSHPVEYVLPKVVSIEMPNNTTLIMTSPDKQVLGQVCAEIRKYRPPEPYKGKGIHFEGEQIIRKAGKTAKK